MKRQPRNEGGKFTSKILTVPGTSPSYFYKRAKGKFWAPCTGLASPQQTLLRNQGFRDLEPWCRGDFRLSFCVRGSEFEAVGGGGEDISMVG